MKCVMLILLLSLSIPSWAGEHKYQPEPIIKREVVTIREKESSDRGYLIGAAVAGGIVWWIAHRRSKRNEPPVVVRTPQEPPTVTQTCPEPDVRIERVFEACVAK